MKEYPIIMSGDHPKKILDGTKTMTRRVIKPQPFLGDKFQNYEPQVGICPYGQVGDRLWVRETVRINDFGDYKGVVAYKTSTNPDFPFPDLKWKPSIFMPRWASRITLEITEVRVERVAEISSEDALKEGAAFIPTHQPTMLNPVTFDGTIINGFHVLWDSLNAKRGYGWDFNPWVWVLSFRRLDHE